MANSVTSIGGTAANPPTDAVESARGSGQAVQNASQNAAVDDTSQQQTADATDLSTLAAFIANAAKAASSQSSIRTDLVASLKAQIAAGTYHPDPDEVAAVVAAAIGS